MRNAAHLSINCLPYAVHVRRVLPSSNTANEYNTVIHHHHLPAKPFFAYCALMTSVHKPRDVYALEQPADRRLIETQNTR